MQIHVDNIIDSNGLKVPTNRIDNAEAKLDTLKNVSVSNLSDGDSLVFDSSLNIWKNSSFIANTLQGHYGSSDGMKPVTWGGSLRIMNVASYNGKAWAEIMFSESGWVEAPWYHWLDTTTNKMRSYNITELGSLEYSTGVSSSLVVPEILTNLLVTAKTSKTVGINENTTIDCSHMITANRNLFFDYFTGLIPGFELLDTFGNGGGAGIYDTHLGYRAGAIQPDEWLIQDGNTGANIGMPLWGYRVSGTNKGAKAGGVDISSSNVFSVWATNY